MYQGQLYERKQQLVTQLREGAAADAKFAATGMIQTERQVFGLAREFLGRSKRGAAS